MRALTAVWMVASVAAVTSPPVLKAVQEAGACATRVLAAELSVTMFEFRLTIPVCAVLTFELSVLICDCRFDLASAACWTAAP